MIFDNGGDERQPHSGALARLLGREERLVHSRLHLRWYALSGIADAQTDEFVPAPWQRSFTAAILAHHVFDLKHQLTPAGHRIARTCQSSRQEGAMP